jgi:hypothetical protein
MDARRRRAERAAATGDPQAQQHLLWLDSQEWGPWALQPLKSAEYASATGDASARDYLVRRYDLRPREEFRQDPHTGDVVVRIDLKHSIWTASPESFRERAPYTLRLIQEGVIDGQLLEHGGSLRIQSSPDKEARYGVVRFAPGSDGWIAAQVLMHELADYDPIHRDETIRLINEPSLERVLGLIDSVEERLLEDLKDADDRECDHCENGDLLGTDEVGDYCSECGRERRGACAFCAAPATFADDYHTPRCEGHRYTDHTGDDGCAVCPGRCEEAP